MADWAPALARSWLYPRAVQVAPTEGGAAMSAEEATRGRILLNSIEGGLYVRRAVPREGGVVGDSGARKHRRVRHDLSADAAPRYLTVTLRELEAALGTVAVAP